MEIKSLHIKKLIIKADSTGWMFKFSVLYEDGSQTTIYDKGGDCSREQHREIPDDFHIVGLYGKCAPGSGQISYLGFTVAKFK